jgi:hypothetical protein
MQCFTNKNKLRESHGMPVIPATCEVEVSGHAGKKLETKSKLKQKDLGP